MSRRHAALEIGRLLGRCGWILAAACLVTSFGFAAMAAEIVDLQVTHLENSTEVVFELDEPAGYRLERTSNRLDRDELLLAIDANASERQMKALGGLVTDLTVNVGGDNPTEIRVGLREPGLLIRDSVRVNPPRLVLSISRPGGAGAASWPNIPAAPAPDVARAKPASGRTGSLQDVRVGSHPTFTRLVFELDAPADYRLERASASELLVTLGASSKALNISSESRYIASVRVEKGDAQTVARVRLNGPDLRFEELTLSNPDRIVIDVAEE